MANKAANKEPQAAPAVGAQVHLPVRPVLTPRDWQAIALRDAAEMCGTPDGTHRLVEAKRYGALADELERLRNLLAAVLPLCEEACADPHIPSESGALPHLQSLRDRVRDAMRA